MNIRNEKVERKFGFFFIRFFQTQIFDLIGVHFILFAIYFERKK